MPASKSLLLGRAVLSLTLRAPFASTETHHESQLQYRLQIVQPASWRRCIDAQSIKTYINSGLGRNAIVDGVDRVVIAVLQAQASGTRASILFLAPDGTTERSRVLEIAGQDCHETESFLRIALKIAIDDITPPVAATNEPPAPVVTECREPRTPLAVHVPSAPVEMCRVPTPPPPIHPHAFVHFGIEGSWGALPTVVPTFTLGLGVSRAAFSASAWLSVDVPTQAMIGAHWVSSFRVTGGLQACGHLGIIAFCGVARAGGVHGQWADISSSGTWLPTMSLGPRVMLGGWVKRPWSLRGWIGLEVPLLRAGYTVAGNTAWEQSFLVGNAGIVTDVTF